MKILNLSLTQKEYVETESHIIHSENFGHMIDIRDHQGSVSSPRVYQNHLRISFYYRGWGPIPRDNFNWSGMGPSYHYS